MTDIPRLSKLAQIKAGSLNVEDRTVDVIFYSGSEVLRYSFFDAYMLKLSLDPQHVDLSRLESGASVLDTHDDMQLSSVIGVTSNPRIEDGLGIVTIRFSKRPEAEVIMREVEDGIIKSLSVGTFINTLENVTEEDAEIESYLATSWQPFEVSFVPVPADPGATVLKLPHGNELNKLVNNNKKREFFVENKNTKEELTTEVKTPEVDVVALKEAAIKEERERVSAIRAACAKAGMTDEFTQAAIENGTDINTVRANIIDNLEKADEKVETKSTNFSVGEDNTRVYTAKAVEEAILNRIDPVNNKHSDNSKRFNGASLLDLATASLDAAGTRYAPYNKFDIAKKALLAGSMSSSDFPLALENVISKSLMRAYSRAPQTWKPFTREVTVPDFKQVSRIRLGEAGGLQRVLEGGEYKHTAISEIAEKYAVKKYGRKIAMTYEMLINDDLSVFSNASSILGRKISALESDLVWGLLLDNSQLMAETGSAIFHTADHNNFNLTAATSDPTQAILADYREAMRLHKDIDGTEPLNIFPSMLYIPASLEVATAKLLSDITPRQESDVNVFGQDAGFRLGYMVEPRLDADANKPWFISALASEMEIVEVARLSDLQTPQIFSREGFDIDGIEYKIRYSFNAHCLDYRGIARQDSV